MVSLVEKKYGKTILINGDDLRKIFELNKYDIKSRKEYVLQYSRLCKFLINQKINVIMSVVGLFHHIHKWNRKILTIILKFILSRRLIKLLDLIREESIKEKVVGVDIIKQIPKKPHISIFNNFEKNQKYYAKKIFNEINNIITR